jgi:hypothetical protein
VSFSVFLETSHEGRKGAQAEGCICRAEGSEASEEGKHDLVEMLVVVAVLCGADTFTGIELWAKERLAWLRAM